MSMKRSCSEGSVGSVLLIAVASRSFTGLCLEEAVPHNGAWISLIIGGAAAIPWVLAMSRLKYRVSGIHDAQIVPLRLALIALLTADVALLLSEIARSAGYLALDRRPTTVLLLPVALAVLWCALKGAGAIGYGAAMWLKLFAVLMGLVLLLQLKRLRPEWLRPLLGSGWTQVGLAGARTAGRIMLASSAALAPFEGQLRSGKLAYVRFLAGAVAIAAAMTIIWLMMNPTMPGESGGWLNRLDALLVNGRSPIYLQLPMIAIWFCGMTYLVVIECITAVFLAHALLPALPEGACAALIVAAATLLAAFGGLTDNAAIPLSQWSVAVLPLCALFALLRKSKPREETAACGS